MALRLPSISALPSAPLDGFAIRNSRGRRVSLLNDDDESFNFPPHAQQPSLRDYPLSPARSLDSEPVEHIFNSVNYYNPSPPITSPSMPAMSPRLPPLNDLVSLAAPINERLESFSRKSSLSSVSIYSPPDTFVPHTRRRCIQSNQPRGSKRRYECATCGKNFTTSGHVARHNRIHTGEKNFQCPEPGCSQRFSRQDNCM